MKKHKKLFKKTTKKSSENKKLTANTAPIPKPKQSSQEIATKASKTLRNDRASKISKSLAGSVLATRRKKGVEK